ncbi:MAG: TraR/DksA C4-type zinc finger protein [Deltaproteobacteria bacterium]|nr:TraR/DksA C4-type zinc finger protein [Deltaproteobacteria bacterium]
MADVMSQTDMENLRETLMRRREEIFKLREGFDTSWKELQEKEVELEETAEKRQLSLGLEQLDEQEAREIEAIDTALRRMETGDYGVCRVCGKPISPRRLNALPWTQHCTRCAKTRKEGLDMSVSPETGETGLPSDFEGMSDDELKTLINEKLKDDGSIELEDLQIDVDKGVVRMEGSLPSEASHEILMEILQDTLGFHELEDHVRIEGISRQREDRDRPADLKKTEEEELLQGEDINEEVFHSSKSGKPVSPPDEFIPENVR